MKVDKNRTIGGAPLIKVRDLLRYMRAGSVGPKRTMTRERIADRVGFDIADELVREGLLAKRATEYEVTDAAVRLANAKMIKRIDRAKAELYIAELLQRADDINANPDLLYCVKRITVFGSYITDAAEIGDIDIAVQRLALIRMQLHDGISQRAFAERLGVSQARYNNWERGWPIPSEQVRKIKDITPGITADWLWWGDTSALTVQVWQKLYPAPKDKEAD